MKLPVVSLFALLVGFSNNLSANDHSIGTIASTVSRAIYSIDVTEISRDFNPRSGSVEIVFRLQGTFQANLCSHNDVLVRAVQNEDSSGENRRAFEIELIPFTKDLSVIDIHEGPCLAMSKTENFSTDIRIRLLSPDTQIEDKWLYTFRGIDNTLMIEYSPNDGWSWRLN